MQQDSDLPRKTPEGPAPDFAPALVIPAFSRAHSLKGLLGSLKAAHYPAETTLVISIDGGGSEQVADLAKALDWPHGEKVVIQQEKNLGIYGHILACCELTEKYGSVVLLEDDLFVSPHFYTYALATLAYYEDDPRIAGIGLYSVGQNPWVWQPFLPLPDRYDVFFAQAIRAWGQVWSRAQWTAFRDWLDNENDGKFDVPWLPKELMLWGENPDKYMCKYLVETDRYFVYPKIGRLTNFCDAGAHYLVDMNDHQVPLLIDDRETVLCTLDESKAVYDAWYELQPGLLCEQRPELEGKEVSLDLFGTKNPDHVSAPYMLTVKPCKNPLATYGLQMRPRELNVLFGVSGRGIKLARTEDVARHQSKVAIGYREHYYYYSHLKVYQLTTAVFAKAYSRARRLFSK